jgi:hypothetical protein
LKFLSEDSSCQNTENDANDFGEPVIVTTVLYSLNSFNNSSTNKSKENGYNTDKCNIATTFIYFSIFLEVLATDYRFDKNHFQGHLL